MEAAATMLPAYSEEKIPPLREEKDGAAQEPLHQAHSTPQMVEILIVDMEMPLFGEEGEVWLGYRSRRLTQHCR